MGMWGKEIQGELARGCAGHADAISCTTADFRLKNKIEFE